MPVSREQSGDAVILTLGDGKANLLNLEILQSLSDHVRAFGEMRGLRTLFLTGAGRTFSTGVDLRELRDLDEKGQMEIMSLAREVLRSISSASKPHIALIDGFCLGGGLELAMACHLRFATRRSKFGFPEVARGIFPGLDGISRAVELAGPGTALDLVLSGEIIGSEEARAMRIITRIFPERADMRRAAAVLSESLSACSPDLIEHVLREVKKNSPVLAEDRRDFTALLGLLRMQDA